MLFNSFTFLCIFFPLVTGLYFVLPQRWRWLLLLAASCWFYMAFVPVYILILGFTIGVDYFAGIWIDKSEGAKRKWLLTASIVANLGVLAFFKYFNFLNESIAEAIRAMGFHYGVPDLGIILPSASPSTPSRASATPSRCTASTRKLSIASASSPFT